MLYVICVNTPNLKVIEVLINKFMEYFADAPSVLVCVDPFQKNMGHLLVYTLLYTEYVQEMKDIGNIILIFLQHE